MMVSVSVKHRQSSVIVQEERKTYGVSARRRIERVYRNKGLWKCWRHGGVVQSGREVSTVSNKNKQQMGAYS